MIHSILDAFVLACLCAVPFVNWKAEGKDLPALSSEETP